MSQQAREVALQAFRTDASVGLLLLSLKAGGVGLNLTVASAVVLFDPWWNPAVEEQAIDRVHRMGQTRQVLVRRYICAGTVEERMLALQERKRELAAKALSEGGDLKNATKLDLNDLKALFARF